MKDNPRLYRLLETSRDEGSCRAAMPLLQVLNNISE